MKLISLLFPMLAFFSCSQEKKANIGEELIDKVYYSVQKGNTLYCSVYYHFSCDTLSIYNSASNQNLKFKINYNDDSFELNNNNINNYVMQVFKSGDDSIGLIDNLNFINLNDTINLKKVNVRDSLKFNIEDKIWGTKPLNINNLEIDSLWLKFSSDKYVEMYTKFKDNKSIQFSKSEYEIKALNNKLNVFNISNQTISFLLINNTKDSLIFFTSKCDAPYESYLKFSPCRNKITKDHIKEWSKIDSKNEFDLPQKLNIKRNNIDLGKGDVNYSLGLNNGFIVLQNGNYLMIDKLTKDTLSISVNNSIKLLEKAVYISR